MRDVGIRIAKMLVEMGLVGEDQAQEAIKQSEEESKSFGQSLFELGHVQDPSLLQLLSAQGAASPWVIESVEGKVMRLLSPSVCREHTLLPVCRCQDLLLVAMAKTDDAAAIERVRILTGLRIEAVEADSDKIRNYLEDSLNENRKPVEKQPKVVHQPAQPTVSEPEPQAPPITLEDEVICEEDTAPVVGLVDQIISDAVRREADGILIEPTANGYDIRYRIDGDLRSIGDIPKSLMPMFEARLRLLAKLDIHGPASPQTGNIELELSSRKINFKVDILPTESGARFLLQPEPSLMTAKRIEDTGIDRGTLSLLRKSLQDGEGLILVAAANGEDRAESMYALLTDLVAPSRDIVSCEDGVSVEISGVSQIRCPGSQLPKSALLRSVLEQSPEVVMVGTLDELCAPLAVRGALSGRLVVASLEATSAANAIARLVALGIDPYLVSASLKGVLAQRRIRTLCTKCRKSEGSGWRAVGCSDCEGSGYSGFSHVFEYLPVSNLTAGMIARKASLHQVEQIAAEDGFRPMLYAALQKVERGTTDVREVERVLGKYELSDLPEQSISIVESTTEAVIEQEPEIESAGLEPMLQIEEAELPVEDTDDKQLVAETASVEPILQIEQDEADAQPVHEQVIESHTIHLTTPKEDNLEDHFGMESYEFKERYRDYYDAS